MRQVPDYSHVAIILDSASGYYFYIEIFCLWIRDGFSLIVAFPPHMAKNSYIVWRKRRWVARRSSYTNVSLQTLISG